MGILEGVHVRRALEVVFRAMVERTLWSRGEIAAEKRLVLHELTPLQASLEEAFMSLTRDAVEYEPEIRPGPDDADPILAEAR